jgi:hypothetical protein
MTTRYHQYWQAYHEIGARDGVMPEVAKATLRTMQVWIWVAEWTASIASGKPRKPSSTVIRLSCKPGFFSVRQPRARRARRTTHAARPVRRRRGNRRVRSRVFS